MRTVLYVAEDEASAQYRYRCKNVKEVLLASDEWAAEVFLGGDLEAARERLDNADLVVIERQTAKGRAVLDFVRETQARGIKVLFDLDDLIFDYRDLPVLMRSTNSRNVMYWVGYVWGIRRIAKRVDGFLCTNGFLAKKLKRSFGKPVGVIRNSLNKEQVEVSEKCLAKKRHEGFVVGYFSGSPTHVRDFLSVEPELIEFLNEHDDAKLRVVGYMEFSREMQEMTKKGKVEFRGKVEYLELQRLMAEVDVSIAPLLINDFTNCKSELKFFEAAAVDTTTIASPTYAFKKAISDGENGFLAKPGEWYEKLEYLYQHPKENRRIALAARKYALKHYYGEEFLKEVEEAYEFFAKWFRKGGDFLGNDSEKVKTFSEFGLEIMEKSDIMRL